jgi:hypothetical protein
VSSDPTASSLGAAAESEQPQTTVSSPALRRVGRATPSVVVVGTGPYGLAAAAHLRRAGVRVHVLGKVMQTWRSHMPAGMLLRSHRRASHIADPDHALGLDVFCAKHDRPRTGELPLSDFVEYGRWFQQQAVPDVDPRRAISVDLSDGGFVVRLDDGESLETGNVVVAAGITPFAWRPPEFDAVPPGLVSHTSDHADLAPLAARGRVVVVGRGQSALESAALLSESGADVEVLVRSDSIKWLVEPDPAARRMRTYAYDRIGIGGSRSSWLFASPALFSHLPYDWRERVAYRATGPAGASWLRSRLESVTLTTGRRVKLVEERNGRVVLGLDDGTELEADHLLLGTGYRPDLGRYDFLAPGLLERIPTRLGAPVLRSSFESAGVPGLHFVGAAAAESLGPVNRFVSGTWAASRSVTRSIAGRRLPRGGFSW